MKQNNNENKNKKINNKDNKTSLKELVEKTQEKEKINEIKNEKIKDKENDKNTDNKNTKKENEKQTKKVISLSDAIDENNKREEKKQSNNFSDENEVHEKREKVKLDELIKKTKDENNEEDKGEVISFQKERNKAKVQVTKNKAEENKKNKEKAKKIEKNIKEYGGVKNNKEDDSKNKKGNELENSKEAKIDDEENLYLEDVDLAVLGVKHDKGPNVYVKYIKEALLTILLIILALIILMIMPIFNVNDLTITNIELLSEEDVKEAINYNKSKNFFHLYLSNPEKKLLELPQVKEVETKFNFPNSLIIRVKEIKIAGYIPYLSEYLYVDSDGQIVEISNTKRDGIPLIEGLNFSSFKLGHTLETTNKQSLNTIIVITNVLSKYEITNDISSIDVTDSDNLRLYVGNIEVCLGDIEDVDQKIRNAMEAISKLVAGAKGTLDVTSSSGRIYFKPAS